jgi:Uncharacterized conserved protein
LLNKSAFEVGDDENNGLTTPRTKCWNEEGDLPHTQPLKDNVTPKGVEDEEDIAWRKGLLRQIGYKL